MQAASRPGSVRRRGERDRKRLRAESAGNSFPPGAAGSADSGRPGPTQAEGAREARAQESAPAAEGRRGAGAAERSAPRAARLPLPRGCGAMALALGSPAPGSGHLASPGRRPVLPLKSCKL